MGVDAGLTGDHFFIEWGNMANMGLKPGGGGGGGGGGGDTVMKKHFF